MDGAKLTPEELEEMEKQFWEIVRKYRPEISEEKNLIQNNKIYAKEYRVICKSSPKNHPFLPARYINNN